MFHAPCRSILLAGTALATLLPHSPASAQDKVGVAGALNPSVSSEAAGGSVRTLVVGADIIFNETIVTGPNGRVQILFVDRSSMTIGPDTRMVIDELAYDRDTGKGTLTATLTQGALRFVGGAISKNEGAVTLKTPTATIGIRGGIGIVTADGDGSTNAGLVFGRMNVSSGSGDQVAIDRPGFGTTVSASGGGPTTPVRAPASLLNALGSLDPGASGNAQRLTDATVAASGVAQANSGDTSGSTNAARNAATPPGPQQTPPNGSPSDTANVHTVVINQATQATANDLPPPSPPPPGPPAGTSVSGRFKTTSTAATGFGGANDLTATGQISPGTLTGSDSLNRPFSFVLGTGSFAIDPATSVAPSGLTSGTGFTLADRSFFALALTDAGANRGLLFGGVASQPGDLVADGTTRTYTLQRDAALDSPLPFVRSDIVGGAVAGAQVSPFFVRTPASGSVTDGNLTTLQASLAIVGTGDTQHSVLVVGTGGGVADGADGAPALSGFVRGTARLLASNPATLVESTFATARDGTGTRFYGSGGVEAFVVDQNAYGAGNILEPRLAIERNQATQTDVLYNFAQPAVASTPPSSVTTGTRTSSTLTGFAAGLGLGIPSSGPTETLVVTGSVSITTDAAKNRLSAQLALDQTGAPQTVLNLGGLGAASRGNSAFISNSLFGATETTDGAGATLGGVPLVVAGDTRRAVSTYLITADTVPVNIFSGRARICECSFLQWGWWGGEIRQGSADSANESVTQTNRFHLNPWVAGTPTPTLPGGGSATYNGNAVGAVQNGASSYIATGGFIGQVDFGTRAVSVAINNFDGRSFAGAGAIDPATKAYSMALSGSGVSGPANGSFFGPSAAETAGNFAVANGGNTYRAAGIFAGKR